MNIEQLKNAWVSAGEKVTDLNAKLNATLLDDSKTEDDVKALQNEVSTARAKRDGLKEQVTTMEAEQIVDMGAAELTEDEEVLKDKFIKDFKAMVKGEPKISATLKSDTDEDGNPVGLTIPVDAQTAIRSLVRQMDSLQEYVTVEATTVQSGSRLIEKMSDITPLKELDAEDGKISDNDDPELYMIKYLIKRYAGINTVTNSLLKDTAENIMAWLSKWISKKVVVTRNGKILVLLDSLPKVEVGTIDDVKDIMNVTLDPAIEAMTMIVTNQDGYNALDKVKSSDGSYLLQKDVTSPTGYTFDGKPIKRIANRFMPSNKGKFPMVIGSLNEAITLFDREQMSLLSTNIGGGAFETDTTKVRVIDRFDVTLVDKEAVVFAEFTKIADQEPIQPPAETKNKK